MSAKKTIRGLAVLAMAASVVVLPEQHAGALSANERSATQAPPAEKQKPSATKNAKEEKKRERLPKFHLPTLQKDEPPKAHNGVTFRVKPVLLPEKSPRKVALEWTIHYTGPRPPLIILKPSLDGGSGLPDETRVTFFAVGKNNECYAKTFSNSVSFPKWGPGKDRFIKVEKDKSFSDKIVVHLDDLRDGFCLAEPDNFNIFEVPSPIYVKLYMKTFARGEDWGFDAWTGGYESDLASFNLTSWK